MPVASPIAWQTIRDGLYDAVNGATGWTTIWSDQDAPQPAYPYITMRIISGPLKLSEQDDVRQSFDAGQPLGEEIGRSTGGMREITVSIQAFQRQSSSTPSTSAMDALTRLQGALGMATYLTALRTAGLSVVEVGTVQNVSTEVDDSWSDRAAMDVRGRLAASVTERGGYIDTTEISPTYTTHGGGSVDPSLQVPISVSG